MRVKAIPLLASGIILLVLAFFSGLLLGSTQLDPGSLFQALFGGEGGSTRLILLEHRLPRVILAAASGAVLAGSGLCFQNILRNPLAEPYILGISGGAAIGSILALLAGLGLFLSRLAAFAGSLIVLFLVLTFFIRGIGGVEGRRGRESILLTGVMFNAFSGSVILFLISMAQPGEVSTIMYWFMGNLGLTGLADSVFYALLLLPGLAFILLNGHNLNLLMLGRDVAESLGLNVNRCSLLLLLVCSLMISLITAVAGPLGFVGLVVPQILRLAAGGENRLLAPACLIYGAAFLIFCDTLARVLPGMGELPVGVVTALIGAPVFIFLQRRAL